MTAYWLMFLLPALMAFFSAKLSRDADRLFWGGTTLLLILLVGLRYEVGGDWVPYWNNFLEARGVPLADEVVLHRDPGYWFFNWLFANLGLGIWAQNLLCATLAVSGIVAIARRQALPWVALTVAVPYLLVVVAMGYVRQAAALGMACWAILAVQERNPLRFLLLATIAAMFHKSAVVIFPLYLLALPRIKLRHWVLLGLMLLVIMGVLVLETLEYQWRSYVEKQKESGGALIRVVMNIPPAVLLLLWKKKLGLDEDRYRLWQWVALVSIAMLVVVNLASTAVDRLALYLLPLQMVVYARVHRLFQLTSVRSAVYLSVLLIYGAVMFVWLTYANHADDWLPYQFYPFAGLF